MAQAPTAPKSGTATVAVGCKLLHGLKIQVYKINPPDPPTPQGDPILLRGGNAPGAVGGFGITEGVDAAQFAAWLAQNQNFPAVKRGLIWQIETPAMAADKAADNADIKTGFERLDPEAPPGGVLPDAYQGRPGQPQPSGPNMPANNPRPAETRVT